MRTTICKNALTTHFTLNVMGKLKKQDSGMKQTREPPTFKFDSS